MQAPDTQALLTLLERETAIRDEAAVALRQAVEHRDRVLDQAAQLAQYRADYVSRWQAQFARSAPIEILTCYRSFMARLDQAVSQQDALAERARASAERNREFLVEAERRVAAVRKLIERRQAEHRKTLDRREQKLNDEAAQRAGWKASQAAAAAAAAF